MASKPGMTTNQAEQPRAGTNIQLVDIDSWPNHISAEVLLADISSWQPGSLTNQDSYTPVPSTSVVRSLVRHTLPRVTGHLVIRNSDLVALSRLLLRQTQHERDTADRAVQDHLGTQSSNHLVAPHVSTPSTPKTGHRTPKHVLPRATVE